MTQKMTLSFVLFFSGMHAMYAADQQLIIPLTKEQLFVEHEQLKKDFNLSTFVALPDDLQLVVLEYLQPDAVRFKEDLEKYYYLSGVTKASNRGKSSKDIEDPLQKRLKEALVGEFFYNHAKKYSQLLQEKKGVTNFFINKIPSQLCTIQIQWNLSKFSILEVATHFYNEDIQDSGDNRNHPNFFAIRLIELGILDDQAEFEDAVFKDKFILIKILLEHGSVKINAQDDYGRTPLHYAASTKLIKLLVKHGADIDAKDYECETALYQSARAGYYDKVDLLLQLGANQDIPDKDGHIAMQVAAEYSGVYGLLQNAKNKDKSWCLIS